MLRKNPLYKRIITAVFILSIVFSMLSFLGIIAMSDAGYYELNDNYFSSSSGGDKSLLLDVPFYETSSVSYRVYDRAFDAYLSFGNVVVSESDAQNALNEEKRSGMEHFDTVTLENGDKMLILSSLPFENIANGYSINITTSSGKQLYNNDIAPSGEYSTTGSVLYGIDRHGNVACSELRYNEDADSDKTFSTYTHQPNKISRRELAEYVEKNPYNFFPWTLTYAADKDTESNCEAIPFYEKSDGNVNIVDLEINSILQDMAWDRYGSNYYSYYYDEATNGGAIIIDEYEQIETVYEIRITVSIPSGDILPENLGFQKAMYDRFYPMRMPAIVVCLVSVVLGFVSFILILFAAGWHKDCDTPQLRTIDKLPFDLFTVIMALLIGVCHNLVDGITSGWFDTAGNVFYSLVVIFTAVLFMLYIVSFVRRIKTRTLLKNNLVVHLFKLIKRAFTAIPSIWTLVVGGLVYGLITSVAIAVRNEFWIISWAFISLFLFGSLCLYHAQLSNLFKAAERIAEGDTEAKVDTAKLMLPLKKQADSINSICYAVNKAVDEKMSSERMKTDLIANVSHDLKTPLTNIINYLDLLKQTEIADPTAAEYIAVLERQSLRLKRLVQDVVDASKASSGCINAELESVNLRELLEQSAAEYGDKFATAGVTPVINCDADCTAVRADGRLLWRVFDNILSNICKYSQFGTRAYIEAKRSGENIIISFRNISAEALNISPEVLMERFVRGDKSRSTEGSGLGLSIARSLVELQNGEFAIAIDGDLFRVTVALPYCEPNEAEDCDVNLNTEEAEAVYELEAQPELPQLPEPEVQPLTEDQIIILPPILPED